MERAGERCSRQKEQHLRRHQGENKLGMGGGGVEQVPWLNHSECSSEVVPSRAQTGRQTDNLLQF